MDIQACERELKKRWRYPYTWGRRQNDAFDRQTRFVYGIFAFDEVEAEVRRRFEGQAEFQAYFDYALNRWYNFWSARAVEEIFCAQTGVEPARNQRDRLVDFTLRGIRFDHKSSVFPKQWERGLSASVNHPRALIEWLYRHQSRQQRQHYANRLFLVLYDGAGEHWQLKAEINGLRSVIRDYVAAFDPARLHRFDFGGDEETVSDIIWAIRCGRGGR